MNSAPGRAIEISPAMCVSGPDGIVAIFSWDYRLVGLSVAVAIVGSFAALDCIERMRSASNGGRRRRFFILGAALMGLAIWTMHFVGMLALNMSMRVSYAPSWSAASIVAAATGAGLAFMLLERKRITWFHVVTGAVAMGLAIVSMHYLGMESMRMPAAVSYEPRLFGLSVVIAIVTSGAALKIGHLIPRSERGAFWMKVGSALVMGLAISGMHYVGMAAARYRATDAAGNRVTEAMVGATPLIDLVAVAGIVFGAALIALVSRTAVERERALAENQRLTAELEARVQARTSELESRNNDLAAFSYSVSHDLRGPLRSISGFADALLDSNGAQLNAEGKHYLDRIRAAAGRMDELLQGLLTLARVSQDPLQCGEVDLTALATAILADLGAQEPQRRVEVHVAKGLCAYGDRTMLTSVLQNLLGNAWKFTAKKPHAKIEVGEMNDRGEQVFFVRDNGVGFNMANVAKLFGMFERLHNVSEFPGHGIGLAVTKRIVERHGGRIWAESVKGESAVFFFTLGPPVKDSTAAPANR